MENFSGVYMSSELVVVLYSGVLYAFFKDTGKRELRNVQRLAHVPLDALPERSGWLWGKDLVAQVSSPYPPFLHLTSLVCLFLWQQKQILGSHFGMVKFNFAHITKKVLRSWHFVWFFFPFFSKNIFFKGLYIVIKWWWSELICINGVFLFLNFMYNLGFQLGLYIM